MKKLLSAVTLALAGLTSQTAVQAAPEDWADDPTVVFHEVEIQSCTKPENNQRSTMSTKVEVIAIKESWDKAMAGKTPEQQKLLKEQMLSVARARLDAAFAPRMSEFTQKDIEDAYEMDSSNFGRDPFRAAVGDSFNKIVTEVEAATGIEVMIGIDARPVFTPGCTVKP
jgi:hypothetical protein